MITAIEIENFKAFGPRQRIELRPITLLFGPNSSGKSTVLHALHYAREIFERHNLDADRTIAGGPYVDLGGFQNFVHDHDVANSVRLRFDLNISKILPSFVEWHETPGWENTVSSAIDEVQTGWLELTISFNQTGSWKPGPYVSCYSVGIDGVFLASLTCTPEPNSVRLIDLNKDHPVLSIGARSPVEPGLFDEVLFFTEPGPDGPDMLAVHGIADALPEWDRGLELIFTMDIGLDPNVDPENYKKQYFFETEARVALLSRLIVGPGRLLRDYFKQMWYVGPLRQTPARQHEVPRLFDPARLATGLAAWDYLHGCPDEELAEISDWLGSASRLNVGYGIERQRYKKVAVDSLLAVRLASGEAIDLEDAAALFAKLSMETRLVLVDEHRGKMQLGAHDVGVGVSQIIPVVVALLARFSPLVAIEQPELHVHPRVQVGIGDLLIERAGRKSAPISLIETHSEHLLLRLLRRIRESVQNADAPFRLELQSLAVHYFEPSENGVVLKQLRVNEDGEFIDNWPGGFFDERGKELFG